MKEPWRGAHCSNEIKKYVDTKKGLGPQIDLPKRCLIFTTLITFWMFNWLQDNTKCTPCPLIILPQEFWSEGWSIRRGEEGESIYSSKPSCVGGRFLLMIISVLKISDFARNAVINPHKKIITNKSSSKTCHVICDKRFNFLKLCIITKKGGVCLSKPSHSA